MNEISRRRFAMAAVGGAALALGVPGWAAAASPRVIFPHDLDYLPMTLRGNNRRFGSRPSKIFAPTSTAETVAAVQQSLDEGLRIAARSGGHCFEDFVDNPRTQAIIDLSALREVRYDAAQQAFSSGPGAQLGQVYEQLHRGWGVTIPGGICTSVGMGGHTSGGGYGALSRLFGTVADHVHGVELVVVDMAGKATAVTAFKDGPNSDLWWAHTGGGGGNFGLVTKFFLRSHDASAADPTRILPRPPSSFLTSNLVVPFASEDMFVRFVGNYLNFFAEHREPGNRFASLYAPLYIRPIAGGASHVPIQLDGGLPDAQARHDEFVAAICAGVTPKPVVTQAGRDSFLGVTLNPSAATGPIPPRYKAKSAYLRKPFTSDQLRILHRQLTDPRVQGIETQLELLPFGGAVNSRRPDATAMPARDTFLKFLIHAAWRDPGEDEKYLAWTRSLYSQLYASTGGVPAHNDANGGAYINYPDNDLRDPRHNRSGVPWSTLYYGPNYPRLQRVKRQWDPKNVFQHALSIEPAQ